MTKSLDLSKPVTTRDGRSVRVVCTDVKGEYPVMGLATRSDNTEVVLFWNSDGSFFSDGRSSDQDLINPPEKIRVERWIRVYRTYDGTINATTWNKPPTPAPNSIKELHIEHVVIEIDKEI